LSLILFFSFIFFINAFVPAQGFEIIAIYNDLNDLAVKNKFKKVAKISLGKVIEISSTGERHKIQK
jgi:hypothetical protein